MRGQLEKGDPSEKFRRCVPVGVRESVPVDVRPYFVLEQPTGHKRPGPECVRGTPILGEEMRQCDRGVNVDHRSLLSSSSSVRSWSSVMTGAGARGGPEAGATGGVNQPFRTASASRASARMGLRSARGGTISATTRSRSVTSTVSPAAARTYVLAQPVVEDLPADRSHTVKVASGSHHCQGPDCGVQAVTVPPHRPLTGAAPRLPDVISPDTVGLPATAAPTATRSRGGADPARQDGRSDRQPGRQHGAAAGAVGALVSRPVGVRPRPLRHEPAR